MTDIILHILTCTLCIVGVHESTREGMIGEKVGYVSRYIFGHFLSKPFTECITCMASVWGTTYFFAVCSCEAYPDPVRSWIVFVLATAGLCATYGSIVYRDAD